MTIYTYTCNLNKYQDLQILWELGDESFTIPRFEEENAAEIHYWQTVSRNKSGSYNVNLPFNDNIDSLGDYQITAYQRFYALERKFSKNQKLKSEYSTCMQDYIDKQHMSLLDNMDNSKYGYYFPYHVVTKETSITTKTRVVYNGSSKTSTGFYH